MCESALEPPEEPSATGSINFFTSRRASRLAKSNSPSGGSQWMHFLCDTLSASTGRQIARLGKDGCIVGCWPGAEEGDEEQDKAVEGSQVVQAVRIAGREARAACQRHQHQSLKHRLQISHACAAFPTLPNVKLPTCQLPQLHQTRTTETQAASNQAFSAQ